MYIWRDGCVHSFMYPPIPSPEPTPRNVQRMFIVSANPENQHLRHISQCVRRSAGLDLRSLKSLPIKPRANPRDSRPRVPVLVNPDIFCLPQHPEKPLPTRHSLLLLQILGLLLKMRNRGFLPAYYVQDESDSGVHVHADDVIFAAASQVITVD
ncbi:hypothetical protein VUR80DRAFT_6408 [Thermomyces stellatus]